MPQRAYKVNVRALIQVLVACVQEGHDFVDIGVDIQTNSALVRPHQPNTPVTDPNRLLEAPKPNPIAEPVKFNLGKDYLYQLI